VPGQSEDRTAGNQKLHLETGLDVLARRISEKGDYDGLEQFWTAVQGVIQEQLGHRRCSLWLQQTALMSLQESELVVGAPNIIIQEHLRRKYTGAVEQAVGALLGEKVRVKFDVDPRLYRQANSRRQRQKSDDMPAQAPLTIVGRQEKIIRPRPDWGFDRLITIPSNELPFTAAREVAGQRSPRINFMYIYGDFGVGKTTLARAIYALASSPEMGLSPVFMSAETWSNEYYEAVRLKRRYQFRSRYRSCRMLILDDVQFVAGKSATQRELMHTLKDILSEGGRAVLAGRPHPEEMRELEPGFLALLSGAFPAVISPPRDEEKRQVAMEFARRRGLRASDGVFEYLAANCAESLGSLESAISYLALYAEVQGRARLELSAAVEALAATRRVRRRAVGVEQVKEAVLEVFDVKAEQLTGLSRTRSVVLARQVGMYLARELTGASLGEIAHAFGRSSHSTVKYAVDKMRKARDEDDNIAGLLRLTRARIK